LQLLFVGLSVERAIMAYTVAAGVRGAALARVLIAAAVNIGDRAGT
jgi:hypothetical protein